jgi:hypothetical protein
LQPTDCRELDTIKFFLLPTLQRLDVLCLLVSSLAATEVQYIIFAIFSSLPPQLHLIIQIDTEIVTALRAETNMLLFAAHTQR